MSEAQIGPSQTNVDNAKDGMLAGSATLVVVSATFVIGRLYSHVRITKFHGFEDLFVLFAWSLSLAGLVCQYKLFHYMTLILVNNFDTLYLESYFYWIWNFIWLYMVGLAAVKFSIAFQYKRMFVTPGFQLYVKVLLGILLTYGLFVAFSTIMSCWPVHSYWTRVRPGSEPGKCLSFDIMFSVYTALNIATDIMIIASPLPVLARMHLPIRQKVSLFVLFTIGGTFVTLISIIKLLIFRSADLQNMSDTTIKNIPICTWSSIEISVSIICSCIPSLKPLVKPLISRFCPSLLSRSSRAEGNNVLGNLGEISGATGDSRRCRESGVSEGPSKGERRWTGGLQEHKHKPSDGNAGCVEERDLVLPRSEERVDSTAEGMVIKAEREVVDSV